MTHLNSVDYAEKYIHECNYTTKCSEFYNIFKQTSFVIG